MTKQMKKLQKKLQADKPTMSKRQLQLQMEVLRSLTESERKQVVAGTNGCSGGGVPSFSATM